MTPDYVQFLELLNNAKVEYVVIGGVAMAAQGSAHVTFDLDVCYCRSPENIQRLCRALKPLHPRLRGAPDNLPFLFDARAVANGLNFTLATDLGDFDLLSEVSGLGGYDAALKESEVKKVDSVSCHVLSVAALLRTKRAAGRNKDLRDIPELEALLELKRRLKLE